MRLTTFSGLRATASSITLALALINPATAQEAWPGKPVTAVVPFPPGQGIDVMARVLTTELSRITGQPFTVMNREGAIGSIGTTVVARAKPDGYTILIGPNTPITIAPHVLKSTPYTFESIVPVCQTFENVMAIFVKQGSPWKTLKDLFAAAQAQPGKLTWGHTGPGSVPHLSMAGLLRSTPLQVQDVSFRGELQMLQLMLSGELNFAAASISGLYGRGLEPLAVFADRRHPAYPDTPTVAELGYPSGVPGLNGVFVPQGTPDSVIAALEKACKTAVDSEGFSSFAAKLRQTPAFLDSAAFTRRLKADYEAKGKLVRELEIKPEGN
jgi:tripartite-type tricarboxylate transporter receptor subunit TctC